LKQWVRSFSGCDGGNIKADIWLCGIEWGGGSKGDYYQKELPESISKGAIELSESSKRYDWLEHINYPYGISLAKLFTAIRGKKVENYREYVSGLGDDELFKTNLYPIAFDSTDHALWHKYKLDEITDFNNKYLFNTWCFFNRFPFFSDLRKEHKPKLVICTGIDYLRDFLMCFGGNSDIDKLSSDTIKAESAANQYDRTYYWTKLDNETLIVVIPFFSGRYGLNSNHLLQEMGGRIKKLLTC
jgi:hypothetical protein